MLYLGVYVDSGLALMILQSSAPWVAEGRYHELAPWHWHVGNRWRKG